MFANSIQLNTSQVEVLDVAKFISSTEAAKRLNVTVRSITEWCKEGRIKGAEKLNNAPNSPWIIPMEGFTEFIEEREKGTDSNGNN